MQDDRGLRRVLTFAWFYRAFQVLVGARGVQHWLAREVWRVSGGQTVLDVGCGTGDMLQFLPSDIAYVGFDPSANYISTAEKAFGSRGRFLVATAEVLLAQADLAPAPESVDVVICSGVLHHLDDEQVVAVLTLAKRVLKPGGRFASVDPVFLRHQDRVSRWFARNDRGKNVRTERAWLSLVRRVFLNAETSILTGLLRVPYVHIVIEATSTR